MAVERGGMGTQLFIREKEKKKNAGSGDGRDLVDIWVFDQWNNGRHGRRLAAFFSFFFFFFGCVCVFVLQVQPRERISQ